MSMNVQPDLDFIRDMKEAGGDTMKKCFQCATCSVVCPLSTDGDPFPRRQMILAQWGMKEQLMSDPNVLLCHNCGDCSDYCPRGAKPGDVMGAIRAYAYKFYGWPKGLAKLTSSAANMPKLIGLPAIIILFFWLVSGGFHVPSPEVFERYGYTQFFGHWDFRWLSKNVFFIDIIFCSAAGFAVFAAWKGVNGMWKRMEEKAGVTKPLYKPTIVQFVTEFFWPSVVEILRHDRFKECETNKWRTFGHQLLMYSFIALFFVTLSSVVKQDIFGIFWPEMHGPFSMWNPIKILANVAAVALIVGIWLMWKKRQENEKEGKVAKTFYDWFLIWIIMGVGVTGIVAQNLRLLGMPLLGYISYYLHLISVFMLFLYMPYTKFAHLVYRTFGMAFEKYRASVYVKDPLKDK